MTFLRVALRLAALIVATGLFALTWAAGIPFAAIVERHSSWRALVLSSWAKCVRRLLGMRVRIDGEAPRGAFLLVTNHVSYVDVVLLASVVRSAFIAKSQVARWPVIGVLARWMGTLFVDRERRGDVGPVVARMRSRLAAGEAFVLFPEGTSTAGESVRAFHSSLFAPATALSMPVRYAALHYSTPEGSKPASLAVAWWGDMRFGAHFLELLTLPHFDARVSFGEKAFFSVDRKALAVELHRAVDARLAPMVQHA